MRRLLGGQDRHEGRRAVRRGGVRVRDAYVSYSKTLMIFLPLLVVHPCVVSSVSSSQPCEQRVIGHSSWYVIDMLRSHLQFKRIELFVVAIAATS